METSKQSCNTVDRESRRKFRSQRFSKSSRKKHLRNLAENKVNTRGKVKDSVSSTENVDLSSNVSYIKHHRHRH